MCFDHFSLLGHSPRGESRTLSLRRLFLLFSFFLVELEGCGYAERHEDLDAYEMRAHAAPVSWHLKKILYVSICTLERMRSSSPLRGELHAGAGLMG